MTLHSPLRHSPSPLDSVSTPQKSTQIAPVHLFNLITRASVTSQSQFPLTMSSKPLESLRCHHLFENSDQENQASALANGILSFCIISTPLRQNCGVRWHTSSLPTLALV